MPPQQDRRDFSHRDRREVVAGRHDDVIPLRCEAPNFDFLPVETPSLRDADRRIDSEPIDRMACDVDLNAQIGRRSTGEVDVIEMADERFVDDIEALIRFDAFIEILAIESRRPCSRIARSARRREYG